uniref:Uncharacterized protein n=1 Tax=Arundo donax TaxID=35708 RepID=A0A0A8Y391_ARUDO
MQKAYNHAIAQHSHTSEICRFELLLHRVLNLHQIGIDI